MINKSIYNVSVTLNQINTTKKMNMKGFKTNIETATLENNNFRKVLYSGKHLQLVLMSLKAGEEIGEEIHHDNDQFFRFEGGPGNVSLMEMNIP